MTIQETGEILEVLTVAYPQFYAKQGKLERQRALTLWQEMFKDYPGQIVAYAVKAFISSDTKGFPPSVGQIMEKVNLLTETPEMTEAQAWSLIRKALRNSAYNYRAEYDKLPEKVQNAVGRPEQLKAWATDERFNEGVESSNFKRAYRNVCAREREVNRLPDDIRRLMQSQGMIESHEC